MAWMGRMQEMMTKLVLMHKIGATSIQRWHLIDSSDCGLRVSGRLDSSYGGLWWWSINWLNGLRSNNDDLWIICWSILGPSASFECTKSKTRMMIPIKMPAMTRMVVVILNLSNMLLFICSVAGEIDNMCCLFVYLFVGGWAMAIFCGEWWRLSKTSCGSELQIFKHFFPSITTVSDYVFFLCWWMTSVNIQELWTGCSVVLIYRKACGTSSSHFPVGSQLTKPKAVLTLRHLSSPFARLGPNDNNKTLTTAFREVWGINSF